MRARKYPHPPALGVTKFLSDPKAEIDGAQDEGGQEAEHQGD